MGRVMPVGEVELFVVEAGPPDGPPVLLLHGFPDSSERWRLQIPALAAAGYRVIAPDQRGFGRSSKPAGVEHYRVELLVGDMVGLLDTIGVAQASIVAHDWGAGVGWAIASMVPDRVERLAVLSVGHPSGYFGDQLEQLEKSWYMLWFLMPEVAETGLAANDWAFLRSWTRGAPDLERWIAHFSADHPANLTAALNWYRANIDPASFAGGTALDLPDVAVPVLGIWSDGDAYCGEGQMQRSADHVSGPWRYEHIEEASHWSPLEAPDHLNALLLDFLGGS